MDTEEAELWVPVWTSASVPCGPGSSFPGIKWDQSHPCASRGWGTASGARLQLAGDAPQSLGPSKGRERNPGSALEPEEQALQLPRLVPRQPGSEPRFLRKAKLPKQINQSVKISLGERLSQLAQPRSSKGNCSRSPRRKQQIVLRSSSPVAMLPNTPPPSLGCREHLCAGDQPGTAPPLLLAPRAVPSPEPPFVGEGQSHCLAPVPVLPGDLLWPPCVWWPLALGRSHGWRWGWQATAHLDRLPFLSWKLGSDGDQGG